MTSFPAVLNGDEERDGPDCEDAVQARQIPQGSGALGSKDLSLDIRKARYRAERLMAIENKITREATTPPCSPAARRLRPSNVDLLLLLARRPLVSHGRVLSFSSALSAGWATVTHPTARARRLRLAPLAPFAGPYPGHPRRAPLHSRPTSIGEVLGLDTGALDSGTRPPEHRLHPVPSPAFDASHSHPLHLARGTSSTSRSAAPCRRRCFPPNVGGRTARRATATSALAPSFTSRTARPERGPAVGWNSIEAGRADSADNLEESSAGAEEEEGKGEGLGERAQGSLRYFDDRRRVRVVSLVGSEPEGVS